MGPFKTQDLDSVSSVSESQSDSSLMGKVADHVDPFTGSMEKESHRDRAQTSGWQGWVENKDWGVTASGLLGEEVTVSQHCEDAKNDWKRFIINFMLDFTNVFPKSFIFRKLL